ncbi:MAG: NADH-quinone oxidoreductase subunit C, partial [Rhizobiales bacterium]|nr:NADH-quinone oxidoreductase subunit C [Hyphomicrobiales bacterium]
MDEMLQELKDYLDGALADEMLSSEIADNELNLEIQIDHILRVLKFLRDDSQCRFVCFIDICGVDYPGREKRFDVVYHLLSPRQNH